MSNIDMLSNLPQTLHSSAEMLQKLEASRHLDTKSLKEILNRLKVSKNWEQIFLPKLLPKTEPSNLFFGRSFTWKICFRNLLTFNTVVNI